MAGTWKVQEVPGPLRMHHNYTRGTAYFRMDFPAHGLVAASIRFQERPDLFGLNMLLQTEEGNVFTWREYRTWLKSYRLPQSDDYSCASAVIGDPGDKMVRVQRSKSSS